MAPAGGEPAPGRHDELGGQLRPDHDRLGSPRPPDHAPDPRFGRRGLPRPEARPQHAPPATAAGREMSCDWNASAASPGPFRDGLAPTPLVRARSLAKEVWAAMWSSPPRGRSLRTRELTGSAAAIAPGYDGGQGTGNGARTFAVIRGTRRVE